MIFLDIWLVSWLYFSDSLIILAPNFNCSLKTGPIRAKQQTTSARMVFSTKKKKLKPKMDLEKALSILFRSEKGSPAMPCSEKGSPAMLRSVKPSPRWTSSRLVRSFKSLALAFTVIVTLLQTAEAIEYTEDKNLYFGAAYMVDKSCHLSAFIMQGSRGFSFEFDTSDDNPDKNIKFFNKDEGQAEICFSTDHAVVPLYDGFIVMVMSKMKEDQPKPFHYQVRFDVWTRLA